MGRDAKDIAKVAFATVGSRIMGFVRDAATMAFMGISAVSAAYTFSFTLPNLFRRLLGEGALTAALVPVFSQTLKREGRENAFAFLNKVLTRAGLLTFAISLVGVIISIAAMSMIDGGGDAERFVLGAKYSAILMPYMALVCLAAVFSAALNVLGSFAVPSITPMLLNMAIVGGLAAGVAAFGAEDAPAIGYSMCAAWIVGGVIQLGLPAYWLRKMGWRFSPDFGKSSALSELYALFIPALVGAAVIQINVFVSKILALFLDDAALPTLYISSRILEFPLGVFTLAIATVYFPKLAKLNASSARDDYKREYANGLVMTMCIAIPAAFGIIATSRDILSMLFQWRLFNARDVSLCLPVLITSVVGLPFFALATFATRGFHSIKDTRTPVRTSYVSFAVNLAFSLALMKPFGAVGLATANVAAAAVQALMLNFKLRGIFGGFATAREIAKIVAAAAAMTALVCGARAVLDDVLDGKLLATTMCCAVIPLAAIAYFMILKLLGFKMLHNLKNLVLRRRK